MEARAEGPENPIDEESIMKHPRIKRAALWLLTICLAAAMTGVEPLDAAAAETAGEVVGYYASWAPYRGYTPDQLDAGRFTQINYAFADISSTTGKVVLANPTQDAKTLAGLTALRKQNPNLKIVLSVGGWDYSTYFSDAASTAARRETFAQSCLDLILAHDLDGVDLDWEYPVSGGTAGVIHRPQDKQNFTLLLKAIRQKLDQQERKDGRDYRLTIAGATGGWYLNNIEPQAVAETVDHVFLMTYDFSGPWSSRSGFNAPLHGTDSVESVVKAWLGKGVAAEKLVLGMPLYGYIYQGVSSTGSGLNSSFTSARSVTYNAMKSTYLTDSAYRQLRHATAQVPYLYGQRTFISYDDPASVAAKAELARDYSLGGIGFWELSQDTAGELVSAACQAWGGTVSGFRDVPETAWYAEAVAEVSEAGLMQGIGNGLFSPGGTVSRGMAAAILYRLAGEPKAPDIPFSDVSASDYYGSAVAWAAEAGVVTGYADGTFRPQLPVSRQQLAALLWRYADWAEIDLARPADLVDYQDADQVAVYAVEPLGWAVKAGLIQGTAEGKLLPQGGALRGQTAVILCRFLELLEA